MVIILKDGTSREEINKLIEQVRSFGVEAKLTEGVGQTIIGLVGDTTRVNRSKIQANENVDRIMSIQEPFKRANRRFKQDDTIVQVGDAKIGGNVLTMIAGPCSVESEEQIVGVAKEVQKLGATALRGGAFKPRTSPYSFQGLELEGLELLKVAKAETGLPIVTEIMSTDMIDVFEKDVDIIQVGARNMQNFDLLKQLGQFRKPILLKRGLSATIEEWLMSAEYIMSGGNENVILCERGIRTIETYTRNTQDLSAVPVIKRLSHLPIIIDPSHAAGKSWMVDPLSKAAVAVGADGLIIEVHNDPPNALCDGQQSITPGQYAELVEKLKVIASVVGKEIK
ncbi:3-deoxy-7-phosphoheptulonate synthase [Candidatus Epulonipiscium fishelsonii]|uniref:3-deoxy-7-phosphoheptulonate synthase n=1 Tax=Candidatus Epulonipiscium fishelsonii TaxID=77094 RepID=A0ACC8XB27_9FIRM|nr:3-deoxy-7-phosphoheptulonate synthase [Epulopiscium sp. SCG-B05WGA-EpuloA1]ONI39473.1 3-deoxy-7-phosphoheptulonate synthase [Epulopiscium sp. SCG-B11WGA-EpuloA1]